MSWTYDWTNYPDIARLRLMVGDTDSSNQIYTDAEILGALAANSSQGIMQGLSGYTLAIPVTQTYSFGRAAAMLLNSLGAVQARALLKQVLDVELDTSSARSVLADLGKSYIEQEASAGYFAISEMIPNSFSLRERLGSMVLRQG